MKKTKNTLLLFFNGIIAGLIAILGYSCATDPKDEYGVPSATFIVKGKIISAETQDPIQNVRVSMEGDTTLTDSNGNYEVKDQFAFPQDQNLVVKIEDMDGSANGSYVNKDTVAEFKDPEYTHGDGHWYVGETTKEINVSLHPKK